MSGTSRLSNRMFTSSDKPMLPGARLTKAGGHHHSGFAQALNCSDGRSHSRDRQGQVVEQWSHHELMEFDGVYADLYRMQSKPSVE